MATLAALKKQMAALEAKMAKATKVEMGGAIARVRKIMADFGLTVEHLVDEPTTRRTASKKGLAKKPTSTVKKQKGGRPAKYVDPATGVSWSGIGRAPTWIATAKNRDDFLIGRAPATPIQEKSVVTSTRRKAKPSASAPVVKKASRKVSAAAKAVSKSAGAAKPAVKKVAATKAAAKRATSNGPAKESASKKTASKPAAKRGVGKLEGGQEVAAQMSSESGES